MSFNYTGNAQYWTVPDCVFSLSVEARGAKGGCTNGGRGAKVNGTVLVTPGQILQINVGGMGGYISAGWNGGGLGETGTTSSCGGGGATDIRTGAYALTDRKIVASGGGGMGGGNTQSMGGHGGCTLGQDSFSSWGKGGYGATQSYGGNGGVGWIGGVTGSNGVLGVGGKGAHDKCYSMGPGGGGGGGYYGGGGGGSDCWEEGSLGGGGGGGGSSLTPIGGSCQEGINNSNGQILITYSPQSPNAGIITANPSTICTGQTTTLTLSGFFGSIQWQVSTNGGSTWNNVPGATNYNYTTPPLYANTCYRVAVTACTGTVYSNMVCITVLPTPTVNIVASNNFICAGESVTLSAIPNLGGGSFLWSPGGQTSQNITVVLGVTTTFTVTYTLNGCTATASYTISVVPQPAPPQIVGLGNNLVCEPYFTWCINNFNPNLSYSWSATGAISVTPTQNGQCADIVWSNNGGVITVVVVNESGCTNFSSLEVLPCCEGIVNGLPATLTNETASNVIGNPVYSNFVAGNIATTNGLNGLIAINGTFTVDEDFDFDFAEVVLNPSAKIIVKPNALLRIYKISHFYACKDYMWKHIFIEPGGELEILSSKIEDAEFAVESMSGAKFEITNNITFNKNYKGVVIHPFSQAHPGLITSTVFSCTSFLLPPHAGLRSEVGVEINEVANVTIGTSTNMPPSAHFNTFDNQNFGIKILRSNVNIYRNKFQNMGLSQQGSGTAIYSEGWILSNILNPIGVINIGNSANNNSGKNIFSNVNYGIVLNRNQHSNILKNDFENCPLNAIRIQYFNKPNFPPLSNVTIQYNKFSYTTNLFSTTTVYGYNNPYISLLIKQNEFNYTASQNLSQAIHLNEITNIGNPVVASIQSNTISGARRGILLTSLNNAKVQHNVITKLNTYNSNNPLYAAYGIRTRNCYNFRIQSNDVKCIVPQTQSPKNVFGISIELSQGLADCNYTENVSIGLQAAGSMPNTQFWTNSMKTHYYGIYMPGNSFLDPQFRPGSNNTKLPADNKWLPPYQFVCRTERGVNPAPNYYYRTGTQYVPVSGGGCNSFIPAFLNINGNFYLCPLNVNTGSGDDIGLFYQIAKGTAPNGDTLKWLSKNMVYNTLLSDSLYNNDTLLMQFRDSAAQANMGILHSLDSVLNNASLCNQATQATLIAVSPGNNIEQNRRDVLDICIGNILNGITQPNPQQIAILQNIAQKCPYTDGAAVYYARVLLMPYDSTEYFDECEIVSFGGERMGFFEDVNENQNNGFINTETEIELFPNPAQTELNISIIGNYDNVHFYLYNVLGEVVISNKIANIGLTKINLSNVIPGIYMYSIKTNGQIVKGGKLIITE